MQSVTKFLKKFFRSYYKAPGNYNQGKPLEAPISIIKCIYSTIPWQPYRIKHK